MDFKKSRFDILQDYIAGGCSMELTTEEMEYYNALYAMVGIQRKYGKDNALAFLQHPPFNCSPTVARRMYAESINLFYLGEQVENEAYRNMLFDNLQKAALVVLKNGKTARDMEIYGNLLTQAARIKQLDKPDPEKPVQIQEKPVKIYGITPEAVGLPASNRAELARLIDAMDEVPEREKVRLRRDAGIEDISIEEMLDDQEKKTQDRG